MNTRYWLLSILALFTIPLVLFGQTNPPPVFDPGTARLPTDVSGYWVWGISVVTPAIVWGITKIVPKIPKLVLPMITPLIGIGLGLTLNKLQSLGLTWVDMTQAGAVAVFIRETWNQTITKPVLKKEGVALVDGTVM